MKRNERSNYNCLIYFSSEDDCWIAHSLHTDQLGTGDCPTEALADLVQGLENLFAIAAEHPDIEIFREASQDIKRMIRSARPLPEEIFDIAYHRVHGNWPKDFTVSSTSLRRKFKVEVAVPV
jgi:hypothetical protein